jgi:hypothetical protein
MRTGERETNECAGAPITAVAARSERSTARGTWNQEWAMSSSLRSFDA